MAELARAHKRKPGHCPAFAHNRPTTRLKASAYILTPNSQTRNDGGKAREIQPSHAPSPSGHAIERRMPTVRGRLSIPKKWPEARVGQQARADAIIMRTTRRALLPAAAT
jgi:hypothetical protein